MPTSLATPAEIKKRWPSPFGFIDQARKMAKTILDGEEKKRVLIVGPCSIHDAGSAIEYGKKLKALSASLENFFLIMRFFIEKPRTVLGWKGMAYDPDLSGNEDLAKGIQQARKLWVHLAEMQVPCATELLDPLMLPYFEDLIVWGFVGARTSASQPHRWLSSGLSFPVGFKNDCEGNLDGAIAGVLSSHLSHSHLSFTDEGRMTVKKTSGNPYTHLVLRGSFLKSNFDPASIQEALDLLMRFELEPRLMVDCSHGNSAKDPKKQKIAFQAVLEQMVEKGPALLGVMLESHLHPGKQSLVPSLSYGVSITDSCLGWEETESLIVQADAWLSKERNFVHR